MMLSPSSFCSYHAVTVIIALVNLVRKLAVLLFRGKVSQCFLNCGNIRNGSPKNGKLLLYLSFHRGLEKDNVIFLLVKMFAAWEQWWGLTVLKNFFK